MTLSAAVLDENPVIGARVADARLAHTLTTDRHARADRTRAALPTGRCRQLRAVNPPSLALDPPRGIVVAR